MSNTTGMGYGFNSPIPYNRRKGGPRFDDLQASSAVNRHIVNLHRQGKNWKEIGETLRTTFPHNDQVQGLRDKQKACNERGLKFRLHISIRQGLGIPATWLYEYVHDAVAATGPEQQASWQVIEACKQGRDIPPRTAWECRRWLDSCFQIDGGTAMGAPNNSINPGNDSGQHFAIDDSAARPPTGRRGRNPTAYDEEEVDIKYEEAESKQTSSDTETVWSTSSGSTWNFHNPSPRFLPWTNPPPATTSSPPKRLLSQLSQLQSQHHSTHLFLQTQKSRLEEARKIENESWRQLSELRLQLPLQDGLEREERDSEGDDDDNDAVELEVGKRNWSEREEVRALQKGIEEVDFAARVRYEDWRLLSEKRTESFREKIRRLVRIQERMMEEKEN